MVSTSSKNQSGISIIQVMVALALAGVVAMTVSSIMTTMMKSQRQSQIQSELRSLSQRIHGAINRSSSWRLTVKDENNVLFSNTNCLDYEKMHIHCQTPAENNGFFPFSRVLETADQILVDDKAHLGLNGSGKPCRGFSLENTPEKALACPYSFRVSWKPLCEPAGDLCKPSSVQIKIELLVSPNIKDASKLPVVNPMNYSSTFVRDENLGALLSPESVKAVQDFMKGMAAGGDANDSAPAPQGDGSKPFLDTPKTFLNPPTSFLNPPSQPSVTQPQIPSPTPASMPDDPFADPDLARAQKMGSMGCSMLGGTQEGDQCKIPPAMLEKVKMMIPGGQDMDLCASMNLCPKN